MKLLSLFLAVLLFATSARAAEQTFSGLFSIDYEEGVYELDAATYLGNTAGEERWVCMLCAEDYLIDVSLSRVEGWEHLSLTKPDDPMTSWYLEDMLSDGVEHIETIVSDGALFCIFRTSDADGEYLLGETVVNGWAISFYAYYDDPARPADDALTEALRKVLQTYQPAR